MAQEKGRTWPAWHEAQQWEGKIEPSFQARARPGAHYPQLSFSLCEMHLGWAQLGCSQCGKDAHPGALSGPAELPLQGNGLGAVRDVAGHLADMIVFVEF